jgi:hypothetical protein
MGIYFFRGTVSATSLCRLCCHQESGISKKTEATEGRLNF